MVEEEKATKLEMNNPQNASAEQTSNQENTISLVIGTTSNTPPVESAPQILPQPSQPIIGYSTASAVAPIVTYQSAACPGGYASHPAIPHSCAFPTVVTMQQPFAYYHHQFDPQAIVNPFGVLPLPPMAPPQPFMAPMPTPYYQYTFNPQWDGNTYTSMQPQQMQQQPHCQPLPLLQPSQTRDHEMAVVKKTGPEGCNIFIYNLPKFYNDNHLIYQFCEYGKVLSATVCIDRLTGYSKCYGKYYF